jgi:hypothetical protein
MVPSEARVAYALEAIGALSLTVAVLVTIACLWGLMKGATFEDIGGHKFLLMWQAGIVLIFVLCAFFGLFQGT